MIIRKILKKDFRRKKLITVVVFTFILLAALLLASGTNLILELSSSLDVLFANAQTPDYVQLHAGELDQAEIDAWVAGNEMVRDQQTVRMISVDGSLLYLGGSQVAEENSIMDISFVTQNEKFDFLLDMNNDIIQLAPGEIAAPVYYHEQHGLELGDTVRVAVGPEETVFSIIAFNRDSQMNPAIIHSKRFVVNEQDYAFLSEQILDSEYLIEFLLTDKAQIGEFAATYKASDLPKTGEAVDQNLFKLFNAISDGLVAGVVILMSGLLMVIAILCLRFTLLATIEEDTKEIGVMKAIGIAPADIKRIYLAKYVALGAGASFLGYLAAQPLNQVLLANLLLYNGRGPVGVTQIVLPLVAAFIVLLIVIISCMVILRRFRRISAVAALRSGTVGDSLKQMRLLPLRRGRTVNLNAFLGLRDLLQRFRLYGLLAFVFFFCAVIIIIPIHFLTTIQSPSFISYMGVGNSDVRIDLRLTEGTTDRFESTVDYLAHDPDVALFAPFVTAQFQMVRDNGMLESFNVECGDFTLFPLDYVQGGAPSASDEIALSVLNAQELEKQVGDTLVLLVDDQQKRMVVSGIYQDITHGGRTAKAALPYDPEKVVSYTFNVNLAAGGDISTKMLEYSHQFEPARVTDVAGYILQTMGSTIQQLRTVTIMTVIVGLAMSILITSLFMNMLITKDASQIAVMRSLGFSLRNIRTQYLTRSLCLLAFGIVLGTLFANTIGQQLVSVIWALMGASRIRFVIDPMQTYLLYPLLLTITVAVTTFVSIKGIKESNIAAMILE